MVKRTEKIIIDTNLWISFLIKRDFSKLDSKIKAGTIKLIFSAHSINEFLTNKLEEMQIGKLNFDRTTFL